MGAESMMSWALSWWLGLGVWGAAAGDGDTKGGLPAWRGTLVDLQPINKHFYLVVNRSPYQLVVVAAQRGTDRPLPPGASFAYDRRRVRGGQGFHLDYSPHQAELRVHALLTRLRELRERAEAADLLSDACLDALDLATKHGDGWDVAATGVCGAFFRMEAGGLRREIAELRAQIVETRLVAQAARTKQGPYAENFVPGTVADRVRSHREVLPYVWAELGASGWETPLSEDWHRQGSLSSHAELSLAVLPEWRWGATNGFSRLRATAGMENVSGGLRHDAVYEVGEPWLVGGEAGAWAPLAGNEFVALNVLQRYVGLDLHTRLGTLFALDLGGGVVLSRRARVGFNRSEPPWFEDPALSLGEDAGAGSHTASLAGGFASRWYGEAGVDLVPMGFETRGGRPDRGPGPTFAFGLEYRLFPLTVEAAAELPLRRAGETTSIPGVDLLRHSLQLDLVLYY